jgi:hypothetical protein
MVASASGIIAGFWNSNKKREEVQERKKTFPTKSTRILVTSL